MKRITKQQIIQSMGREIQKLKNSNAALRGHLKKTKEELKGMQYLNGYKY